MSVGPDGLLALTRMRVPRRVIDTSVQFLQKAGASGNEALLVWVGTFGGGTFDVKDAIAPPQRAINTGSGCCVVIDSDGLFALGKYLEANAFLVGAQVHAHPDDAYHSDTDDAFPVATLAGALSFVLPDFAAAGWSAASIATFQLSRSAQWVELKASAAQTLIEIVEA